MKPVGAGLPAMAVCQAITMLDVLDSSRASPLPQGSMTLLKPFRPERYAGPRGDSERTSLDNCG
ncbi:hypothetical protein CKQ80_16155 [Pseudomonas moraviensis]|uniref:Uncharacterized protein n=1 Tax=Pseudomonas moraviensis TaxID=321662 RepID=A0A2A2PNH9_9PSED|nr:hypothetical protein CKQ68_13055 [Pseudomonas moraviensis]PAW56781.1 hypothetical protein CKQ80_16155 [Pseudomonas moraviensis]